MQEPEERGWPGEGQVITTNQKRDPLQRLSRQRVDTHVTRSALKAWRRAAGSSWTWYRKSFFCFRSGCYLLYGARRRPGADRRCARNAGGSRWIPGVSTTSGVAMPRRVFTACGVGSRPPERGGPLHQVSLMRGCHGRWGHAGGQTGDDAGSSFSP